jgi:hypothetical protein
MENMSTNSGFKMNRMRGALALAALCVYVAAASAQAPPGGPPGGGAFPPGGPDRAGGPPPGGPGGPGGPGAGGGPRGGGGFAFGPKPLPANAPAPSPDPRNFDGTWYHADALIFQNSTDVFGNPTPFNDLGRKVMARRVKSLKDGTPFLNASAKCFPVGQPWQMDLNMPFHIYQSKDRLEVLFEEYHGLLTFSLDPAKAPPAGYMGRSVAHWDGDTLVVETSGYKDGFWIDVNGTPASKNAKLTQRYRKVKSDHWYLEVLNTIEDPTYYTRPWSWMRAYDWRPDMAMYREYNCELQTGAKGGLDPSLVPEPQD